MYAGGTKGTLTFSDTTGVVSGTIEDGPISGFFDETAQTLVFMVSDPLITKGGYKGVLSTPFTNYQAQLIQVGSGSSAYYVLTGVSWEGGNDLSVAYSSWYALYPAPIKLPKAPTPPPPPHVVKPPHIIPPPTPTPP
jgi:hypothetical protein